MRSVTAGALPQKYIDQTLRTFQKILKAKIPRELLYDVDVAKAKILDFLRDVQDTILATKVHHWAERGVQSLIDTFVSDIQRRCNDYDEARRLPLEFGKSTYGSPQEYLRWKIADALSEAVCKVDTLEKIFTVSIQVDVPGIHVLAERLFKKAPKDIQRALEITRNDWGFSHYEEHRLLTKFLAEIPAKARKLLKKEKKPLAIDLEGFFKFIHESDPGTYTKFDFHGMTVLVSDPEMPRSKIRGYIKYLDEAFERLRAKGFQKLWKGFIYLQCPSCGGASITGRGVAGDLLGDTVNIYAEPGPYVVYIMAHELGHRYWYEGMRETQREYFRALLKTHKTPTKPSLNIPKILPPGTLADFRIHFKKLYQLLEDSSNYQRIFEYRAPLSNALFEVKSIIWPKGRPPNEHADQIFLDIEDFVKEIYAIRDLAKDDNGDWGQAVTSMRKASEAFETHLGKVIHDAYMEDTKLVKEMDAEGLDKKWMEEYEADTRPVLPVSNYGSLSPEEAFAEVFAHYIMGKDMSRDQLESFKQVLKTASTAFRVRFAWVQTLTAEFERAFRTHNERAIAQLIQEQARILGVRINPQQEMKRVLHDASHTSYPGDVWDQWVRDLRRG